jgi:hypothetical protein
VGRELGPDFLAQGSVKVQHILPGDAAQFEMSHAVLAADPDLLVELRRNLVGEGGQLQHKRSCLIRGTRTCHPGRTGEGSDFGRAARRPS